MDFATLGGIVGGFVLMLAALILAGSHGGSHGVSLGQFVDPPAAIMVVGGGLCVVLTSVPLKIFLGLPKIMMKLLFNRAEDLPGLIEELVRLAEIAARTACWPSKPRSRRSRTPRSCWASRWRSTARGPK